MKFTPKALTKTADASRGHHTIWEAKSEFLVLAAFFGCLMLITVFFADLFSALIPDKSESLLAPVVTASLMKDFQESDKDADYHRAKAIFDKIMATKRKRNLDYRLVYMKSDIPNAFAAPGGAIGVTSGLMGYVESEVGVAMVIAHELGHHYHRHVMRSLSRSVLLNVLLAVTIGDNLDAVKDGVELTLMKFSRDQEYEADEFGIRLVKELYGTTEGSAEFFEDMLATKYSSHESPFSEITSSHPLTKKRISRLKAFGKELDR